MTCAEVKEYNGELTIFVNDKPIAPMFMLMRRYENKEYIKSLYASGLKVYFIYAETDWMMPGEEDNQGDFSRMSGFDRFKVQVEELLENAPDAYIITRIYMHPPAKWVDENPDEVVRYSDGKTMPCTINGINYSGHYQMSSEKWQKDAAKALNDFCDKVDKSSFADRIIGYFFCAGGTCEWYYVSPVIDYENNRVADYSPAFRKVFSKYLKEKYKTEENLKKAWRRDDATFENPYIAPIEERSIVEKGRNFAMYAKNRRLYYGAFPFDCSVESDGYNIDMFLDCDKYMYVADFYDAWHNGVADSVIYFAREIKERYNRKMLTGAFFGACGCTHFYDSPTSGGALKVINSGMLDFLSTPGTYINRQPGGSVAQREMTDSLRLHNMIFMSEDDSRTHLSEKLWALWGKLNNERDSVVTLKRDFARNICDGTYSWWFDLTSTGKNWYKDEVFYKLFEKQQKISEIAYKYNRGKNNEIAAIYSSESFHCVTEHTTALMVDYYRNSEIHRIGAGIDFYFHNDMDNEDMPDYKVYLMINLFNLTDAQRQVIRKKAAKNGAMIIWLYAPGYINPDKDNRICVKNIEDTTGMHVEMGEELCVPSFKVDYPINELVKYANPDREYGHITREYVNNISFFDDVGPYVAKSYFYIDDDSVTELGKYSFNDKCALAMKKNNDGVTDVYCATRILHAELITSLAEYMGCHIFNNKEDCIYANNNFVTVHAYYTGKHIIKLREKCNPFEVYEKKYYGKNVDTLEIEMKKGDTLMFSINDSISKEI